MKHFLLAYKRSEGRFLEFFDLGTDQVAAAKERSRLEEVYRRASDVEVVLLSSPSLEALQRTHARYFKTVGELADTLRGST